MIGSQFIEPIVSRIKYQNRLLFISTIEGELVVARASPDKYEELGRKSVLGFTRQAPALANGLLYLRDDEEFVCLDVSP